MGTALALVVLAGCALLLLPIPVSLVFQWDRARERTISFVLRVWGIAVVRFPDPSRPSRPRTDSDPGPLEIPPWLDAVIDWTIARWKRVRARSRDGSAPKGDPVPLVVRLLLALVARPTRRVRLELGGFDPALLAVVRGGFLVVEPLLPGNGRFDVVADWTAVRPKARLAWSLRFSIAGWLGGVLAAVRGKGRVRGSAGSAQAPVPDRQG